MNLLKVRKNIHATVNAAREFSTDLNLSDSEALSILGFNSTNRSALGVTDEEILSHIDDIKERLDALMYVILGVYAEGGDEEDRKIAMYGVDRFHAYTGEKLEDFNLWEEMVNGHPNNAAVYQNRHFG